MKKRTLFVLLFTVITFACAIGFVACDTQTADEHTLTHVEATAATCTEDGNAEYWVCSDCGKYFSDADATTEISQSDTVIPAKGHSYGEWTTVKDATCTEDGTRERECTVCHEKEQEIVSATGHTFSEAWSKDDTYHWHAATCGHTDEVSGKAEHSWDDGICSVCGAPKPSEGLDYTLFGDGTAYSVTGIGTCTDTIIVIPSAYNGLPVTSIGNYAFEGRSSLTSITIPDSVTSIGIYAFEGCTSLTSINIPDGVTSIGLSAFYGCSSLTSITIPDSVTSIGYTAFYGCSSLESVTIGNGVTSIGNYVFQNCTSLTSIIIPDSVTFIGNDVFKGCSSIKSVYITDIAAWCNISFTTIESNPLYYSANLYLNGELVTELIIPDGVTSIGRYTFYGCTSLTSITIPDGVTSIGSYAFYGCASLESVTIGKGVTSIGYSAFNGCTSLTSVTIPDSVTSIGSYAFGNCSSLTSINIPDSVTSIGSYAFINCYSLTSATFENTSGWYVSSSSTATSGEDISSEDLADPATAATYLKSTYYTKYWYRS